MRRSRLALSAGFMAVGIALAVSIFVVSAGALALRGEGENAATAQYGSEDPGHTAPPQDTTLAQSQNVTPTHPEVQTPDTGYYDFYARWLARGGAHGGASSGDTPSEGSDPRARAPAAALSIMEPPSPYSQVVDNASLRRFYSAREWKKGSERASRYGKDYRYIKPAKDASPAWFRVKIPTAGYYTVYARWPAAKDNNPATRFQISTASGLEKTRANQRKDGGVWVRLGAYEMEAGNRYSVQVAGRSKDEGRIVADAVMVVGGTQAPPQVQIDQDGPAREPAGAGETAADGSVAGAEAVERARTHVGTPYRHSPPLPCQAYRSEDCSCLTSLVFGRWMTLPDDPIGQWNMGRSVERSELLPGDLVFFKEAGESYPITHVAIYSGSGNIIHASTYWGRVVERPMKYVSGYYGAKRLS
jgi:hypothetical protein